MLNLIIPPPIQMAIFGVAMWLIDKYLPRFNFAFSQSSSISLFLVAAGCIVAILGIVEFIKAQTTINPHNPENTSQLVKSGIYQFTRNPMYVGLFLVLAAWGFYLANFLAFICLPLFSTYITQFQILPEEKVLQEKFKEEFREYANDVRRWI